METRYNYISLQAGDNKVDLFNCYKILEFNQ